MATLAMNKKPTESGRMLRFMTVGASGTLLDFAVLALLKEVFLLPTMIANVASFCAGLLNNFTWNRLWTFADARNDDMLHQFAKFAAVSVVGLLVNTLVVLLLEAPFNTFMGGSGGYLPAKIIATGVVFVWNFTANRTWTFNVPQGATS